MNKKFIMKKTYLFKINVVQFKKKKKLPITVNFL